MKIPTLVLMLAAPLLPTLVMAGPFEHGDAAEGEKTHAQQCVACHVSRVGGDGSKIYTRPDRRANTASGLTQMITTCNAMLGNNLFPEDELHLAAYLNGQYYKFK